MTKRIRPTVVLIKDGRLLVLRSRHSGREFYMMPGGGIEGMETVKEAAVREAKEETNYDIEIVKLLYVQEFIDKAREKDIIYMIFLGNILGGEETHLNDPCLWKGNIIGIEWIDIGRLHEILLYPEVIVPLLKKDYAEGFARGAVFLDAKVI